MKNWISLGVMVFAVSACGGAPVRPVSVEAPQFKVSDAAPGGREYWLDNPNSYAKQEGLDVEHYYFYVGDAQSADKRMACEKAGADAMDDIAKQVSTFVDSAIARATSDSTGSDTNAGSSVSASQTETTRISSQLSKALVSGVEKNKQYWEQRDFSQNGGAKSVYYCWILAKVGKKQVDDLIVKAQSMRFKNDPALKAKVEDKLSGIEKQYDQFMQVR